jgi:hypothetical protein
VAFAGGNSALLYCRYVPPKARHFLLLPFQALRRQTLHEGGAQLAAFFAASVANIFVFENGLFPWAVGVWVLSAALATTWCRLIKVGEIDSPSIYLNGIPKDVQEKNIWMDDVRRVSANQVLGFRGSS